MALPRFIGSSNPTPAARAGTFAGATAATLGGFNPLAAMLGPGGFFGGVAISAILKNIMSANITPEQRAQLSNELFSNSQMDFQQSGGMSPFVGRDDVEVEPGTRFARGLNQVLGQGTHAIAQGAGSLLHPQIQSGAAGLEFGGRDRDRLMESGVRGARGPIAQNRLRALLGFPEIPTRTRMRGFMGGR